MQYFRKNFLISETEMLHAKTLLKFFHIVRHQTSNPERYI